MNAEDILVSICCPTYNHKNYIRQCLDGFVMQKTSFAFEVLVHEDASSDSTGEILMEYELKYPNLFRCVYQKENQFLKQNTLVNILFRMAKGKYIALCEGDDYWTDPLKLQKQVDFLEKNPEYSFCCTNITVIDEFGVEQLNAWPNKSTSFSINKRSLGLNLPVPTCSLVFRADSVIKVKGFLKEMGKYELADYFLKSWLLIQGKGHFFEEKMAVYRQHSGGIYTQMTERKRLKKLKKARAQLLLFCIKKGHLFSALICIKNMLFYPNF